jgi:hypothetical protein
MTARKNQTDDTASLEEQFSRPLDDYVAKTADSASAAADILSKLQATLESKQDDWSVRHAALQDAISYLKGSINRFENCDYGQLAQGIAMCISDLRSTLVKTGSLLITASAMSFGSSYVTSIDTVTPPLFKQLSHATAIISNSCHLALLKIAEFVPHRRTIRLFLSNHKSKTGVHRQVVAEVLSVIRQNWPWSIFESFGKEMTVVLSGLAKDPVASVRKAAETALKIVPVKTRSGGSKRAYQNLIDNSRGRLSRETVASNSADDISQYLPPKSVTDAKEFLKRLRQVVGTKNIEPLTGLEEFIPDSVIASSSFMPRAQNWDGLLPPLLELFHSEFSGQIGQLIVAFKIARWVIEATVKEFGVQKVIDSFQANSTSDQSLLFFSGLLSLGVQVDIENQLQDSLAQLIAQHPNSTEARAIEKHLGPVPVALDRDQLVSGLVARVRTGQNWISRFEKLVVAISRSDPDFAESVEADLTFQFAKILNDRNPQECSNLRDFIYQTSQRFTGISFAGIIEPMLWMAMDEDRTRREQTEQCCIALMADEQAVPELVGILHGTDTAKQQTALNLLHLFAASASLNQLVALVPLLMPATARLFQSDVTTIRRLLVLILAELRSRVPMDFNPHFNALSGHHQKLVELYIRKRAAAAR